MSHIDMTIVRALEMHMTDRVKSESGADYNLEDEERLATLPIGTFSFV